MMYLMSRSYKYVVLYICLILMRLTCDERAFVFVFSGKRLAFHQYRLQKGIYSSKFIISQK